LVRSNFRERSIKTNANRQLFRIEWYSPFDRDYSYHFRLIQLVAFLYAFYRLMSRDYSVYGFLDDSFYTYPRWITNLYPVSGAYIFTFQFLHDLGLPRLGQSGLNILQLSGILFSVGGLLGILPRFCAWALLAVLVYLTGLIQATNAEIDGGTLCLVALFCVAVSEKGSPYAFSKKVKTPIWEQSPKYRWPVFLFFMLVSAFYVMAGINKLVDVGPQFPFVLHLENLATKGIENSIFASSRYVHPVIVQIMTNPILSYPSGLMTLIAEVGFCAILFLPNWRWFFVGSMIGLHVLVFMTAGINFLGSIAILLLCLDWNRILTKFFPRLKTP